MDKVLVQSRYAVYYNVDLTGISNRSLTWMTNTAL